MPLTKFQKNIFGLLKASRNPESYIAGGTAINQSEDSLRYANDIGCFHDTDRIFINQNGTTMKNPEKATVANSIRHYGSVKGSWPRLVV